MMRAAKKIAAAFTLCASMGMGCKSILLRKGATQRDFTPDEKTFVSTLTGGHINFNRIQLIADENPYPIGDPDTLASFNTYFHLISQLRVYKNQHSPDFVKEADVWKFGYFVHEIFHAWQDQNIGWDRLSKCPGYKYNLDEGKAFHEFCFEQQASIVEDYARRFLHAKRAFPYRSEGDPHLVDHKLINIVEKLFPAARKMREAMAVKMKGPKL